MGEIKKMVLWRRKTKGDTILGSTPPRYLHFMVFIFIFESQFNLLELINGLVLN